MKVLASIFLCAIAVLPSVLCEPDAVDKTGRDSGLSSLLNATQDLKHLEGYVNDNVDTSMKFLLMSAHFGHYNWSRDGFQHLYRKLSDEAWKDAIDVIKYVTMRGGKIRSLVQNYVPEKKKGSVSTSGSWADLKILDEPKSLKTAVDYEKYLARRSFELYEHDKHDPAIKTYLQNNFMHKHTEAVRKLVGLSNDLTRLLKFEAASNSNCRGGLPYFTVDEYIKKYL